MPPSPRTELGRPRHHRTCAALLAAASVLTPATAPASEPETELPARNVILVVGDGMGDQQITIARNYLAGAQGSLLLDAMPVRSVAQVLTVEDTLERAPIYVADSANTATSLATGVITSRGRIATSAGDDRDIPTIVELAEAAGLRSGIVTTSSVTDATPASFAAHVFYRLCENPDVMLERTYKGVVVADCPADLKASGGRGSISEQLATAGLDVLLGGGTTHFEPLAEGSRKTVLQLALESGAQQVFDASGLAASEPGAPLLGLFAEEHMPVRLRGEDDRVAVAPSPSFLHYLHPYLGDVTLPEPMACEPNPNFEGPTLKQMTDAALRHLASDDGPGFFLLVESASIDKQSHLRRPCGSIGEVEQLEEALASILAFADSHPETLVLVTADHSHAAQIIPNVSPYARFPVPMFTPGLLARIRTPEGGLMAINYATSTFFAMEDHTGAHVPVYANRIGEGLVPPFVRQPDLFRIMVEFLGLESPTAQAATAGSSQTSAPGEHDTKSL